MGALDENGRLFEPGPKERFSRRRLPAHEQEPGQTVKAERRKPQV
jgi:hypothetical protein